MADFSAIYVLYESVGMPNITFIIRCGQAQLPNAVCPWQLYEKVVFKSTSAEPLPRRAIGTGQLSRLRFRAGPIARRGGGRHNAIFYLRCVRQDMWVYMKVSSTC